MAEDEILLALKLMIMRRPDGTRYIKKKKKISGDNVTEQDMAVFGLHIDCAKQDILEGFQSDGEDVEIESINEGLF